MFRRDRNPVSNNAADPSRATTRLGSATWYANSRHRCARRCRSRGSYRRPGVAVRRLPAHPVEPQPPDHSEIQPTAGGESTIHFVSAGPHSVVTLRPPAVANAGGAGRMIVGAAANRFSDASQKLSAREQVRGAARAGANRRVRIRRPRRPEVCWCGGRHGAVPCARTVSARSGPGGFDVGALSDSAHTEPRAGSRYPLRYPYPNRTTNHIRRVNRGGRGAVRGRQKAVHDKPKSDWGLPPGALPSVVRAGASPRAPDRSVPSRMARRTRYSHAPRSESEDRGQSLHRITSPEPAKSSLDNAESPTYGNPDSTGRPRRFT